MLEKRSKLSLASSIKSVKDTLKDSKLSTKFDNEDDNKIRTFGSKKTAINRQVSFSLPHKSVKEIEDSKFVDKNVIQNRSIAFKKPADSFTNRHASNSFVKRTAEESNETKTAESKNSSSAQSKQAPEYFHSSLFSKAPQIPEMPKIEVDSIKADVFSSKCFKDLNIAPQIVSYFIFFTSFECYCLKLT